MFEFTHTPSHGPYVWLSQEAVTRRLSTTLIERLCLNTDVHHTCVEAHVDLGKRCGPKV